MKYLLTFLALCFALLSPAQSSMQPIYLLATKAVSEIEKDGFEIVRLEFDILSTGSPSRATVRNLYPAYEYQIFAFGDERIKSLEIEMYIDQNGEWSSVSKQTSNESSVGITYRPTQSAQFLFEVRVTEFAESYNAGHFVLLAAHDGESPADPVAAPTDGCDLNARLPRLQFFTSNIMVGLSDAGEEFNFQEAETYVSLFKVDEKVSKITHATDSQTSVYNINTKECGDNENVYVFDVTSDAGFDYIFSLDLNQNKLFVLGYTSDEQLFAIVYELSRVTRE